MPHQCVRCNTLYEEGSNELLKGCSKCGGKFFFYLKHSDIEEAKKISENLTQEQKQQIEQDVFSIIENEFDPSMPVFLDFESVRILSPGKYELDIVNLFRGKPIIYKIEDGKYIIDLKSTFRSIRKEKEDERS
ncbi:hypothetical protein HYX18_04775 [Candidatus Woesearchaeota archaeon]|nr:hypothetical protein [Candidatus Woesearchaeota archaeon]